MTMEVVKILPLRVFVLIISTIMWLLYFNRMSGGIADFDYSIQLNVFGGLMPNNPLLGYQRIQTKTIYSSGYQYSHTEATPVLAIRPV